jgi:hypothetical protein
MLEYIYILRAAWPHYFDLVYNLFYFDLNFNFIFPFQNNGICLYTSILYCFNLQFPALDR